MSEHEHEYTVVIELLGPKDGGGYLATAPDLPGCMADGRTRSQAAFRISDAIRAWIAAAGQLGRTVPPPTPGSEAARRSEESKPG